MQHLVDTPDIFMQQLKYKLFKKKEVFVSKLMKDIGEGWNAEQKQLFHQVAEKHIPTLSCNSFTFCCIEV